MLGFGVLFTKSRAVITIPGVQNPHCIAPFSTNFSCNLCNSPFVETPSIVVISAPSYLNAGVMQLNTGSLLTITVHAPQLPCSQPTLVPVNPAFSRITLESISWSFTKNSCCLPFILSLICFII